MGFLTLDACTALDLGPSIFIESGNAEVAEYGVGRSEWILLIAQLLEDISSASDPPPLRNLPQLRLHQPIGEE
ncbi:MAG: hypothetical protein OXM87_02615, partial [Truepera sp.]|nr:hypothetical protein [Truepera sp.]